jgi:hypothetical protein
MYVASSAPGCDSSSGASRDGGSSVDGARDDGPTSRLDGALPDSAADAAIPILSEPTCTPVSGERLRVRWLEGGGAARQDGLHDRMLAVDCAPGDLGGGDVRCVPTRLASGTLYYLDAACTQAVLFSTEAAPAPYWQRTVAGVPEYSRLGAVTTMVGGETIYFRSATDGACAATTASAGAHHALATVSNDTFAALEGTVMPADGRVTLTAYESADGARTCGTMAYYDHELDAPCMVLRADDGIQRCMAYGPGSLFAAFDDAACSRPRVIAVAESDPRYQVQYIEGSCGTYRGLSTVGRLTARTFHLRIGDSECLPYEIDATTTAFGVSPLLPTGYAAAPFVTSETTERLAPVLFAIEDGPASQTVLFYDRELDSACYFDTAADGMLRCIPYGALGTTAFAAVIPVFSDAACTTSISLARSEAACTIGEVRPEYAIAYDGAVSGTRAYSLGPRHEDPVYVIGGTGACEPAASATFFELQAEILPTALVPGARRTD